MPYYNIAGLTVEMNLKHDRIKKVAANYLSNAADIHAHADFSIVVSDDLVEQYAAQNPALTTSQVRYILECSYFSSELLNFNSFVLHASAIMYQGVAYLFSAHSGIGKSTHTKLWQRYFGEEKITYINDDKPVIRKIDGKWCACGSPFCGKNDLGENIIVPIGGVAFLKRSDANSIALMPPTEAVFKLFDLTLRPSDVEKMDKLMSLIEAFISEVPIYSLKCNMSLDAAKVAYEGMSGCKTDL